jgi:signal transduction histidine kinase
MTVVAEGGTNKEQSLIVTYDLQHWAAVRDLVDKPTQAWRGPDDVLWAMTSETLLNAGATSAHLVEDNDISARSFFDVAVEPSGAFWLATSDGLFRYAPLCWQVPGVTAGLTAPVRCIASDKDGIWFIAGNALYSVRQNQRQAYALPAAVSRALQNTTRIFPVSDGTLVLEVGEELLQLDTSSGSLRRAGDPQKNERLKAVGFFQDGVLVLRSATTPDGVVIPGSNPNPLWELKTFDGRVFNPLPIPQPPESIGPMVSRIFTAENGDVWVSAEVGTAVFHEKKWRVFAAADKTAPGSAVAFATGTDGRIWCAGSDRVWEFDGKDWSNARGGFDRINSLLSSKDGSIWVASDAGLFRFFRGVWVENGVEEGLPVPAIRDVCQDRNERLWAAASAGLSLYNSRADLDPPRTEVFPIGEKERNVPEGGALSVSFTGVDKWKFTPRFRLLYSRRVDGGDWSAFRDSTAATLADLGPGKHEFQVRAMDRNGNVDAKPAILEFAVVLPWYHERRLVLISSAGAAAVLFFAALAFNRHRRLVRSHARVEREITERTRELELANRELLQSQKMNALGTLAAGIAHDFNNILSIVKGSAQIIEENLENPAKVRTRVDRIKTVVEQGSGIVKAMLGFSRDTDQQTGPCDLNATVDDTIRLLGDRFLREVEVRFDPVGDLPPATCSKDFVQQILLNFIFNAADSMAKVTETVTAGEKPALPGGRAAPVQGPAQIVVGTRSVTKLSPNLVLAPATAPAYVSVSVQDHGCGIPSENLSRIFEPFFTTKALSTRRGTGLGLSMAYELAKKMGAGLAVQSIVNQGSTFILILPASDKAKALDGPSPSPVPNRASLTLKD